MGAGTNNQPKPWEVYGAISSNESNSQPKPWEVYKDVATPQPYSKLGSAGRGLLQGGSLGFADEIAGAVQSPIGAAKKAASYVGLSDANPNDPDVQAYNKGKQDYRAEDEAAKLENPKSFIAGNLGGGLLTAFVPGLGIAKGAGTAANLARVAGAGAINSIGSGEQEGSLGNVGKDAAIGAGAGVVGYGLGQLAQKLIPEASKSAEYAEKKIVEHLRPTPKVARVLGPDRLKDVGREVLDSGAVTFGAKATDTAAKLSEQRQLLGKAIGDILENSEGKVNLADLASNIEKNVIEPIAGQAANQKIVDGLKGDTQNLIKTYVDKMMASDEKNRIMRQVLDSVDGDMNKALPIFYQKAAKAIDLSPQQLELEKRAINKGINYLTDPKAAQEAKMGLASTIKEASEGAVNNPMFQALKDRFGKTAEAQAMAERTAGLTDSGTGLLGHLWDMGVDNAAFNAVMHGEPITGGLLAGGRALTKGKVNSAIGVTADQASKLLQKYPWLNKLAQGAETVTTQGAPVLTRGLVNKK